MRLGPSRSSRNTRQIGVGKRVLVTNEALIWPCDSTTRWVWAREVADRRAKCFKSRRRASGAPWLAPSASFLCAGRRLVQYAESGVVDIYVREAPRAVSRAVRLADFSDSLAAILEASPSPLPACLGSLLGLVWEYFGNPSVAILGFDERTSLRQSQEDTEREGEPLLQRALAASAPRPHPLLP